MAEHTKPENPNLERIEDQILSWAEEEPEDDWWNYQRDFAAMFAWIVAHQDTINALEGIADVTCVPEVFEKAQGLIEALECEGGAEIADAIDHLRDALARAKGGAA